jgi:hypothetical protein
MAMKRRAKAREWTQKRMTLKKLQLVLPEHGNAVPDRESSKTGISAVSKHATKRFRRGARQDSKGRS